MALLAAVVFAIERFDDRRHEIYYWLVIMIIRTGATNIADCLAFKAKIPPLALTLGLIALLGLFALGTRRPAGVNVTSSDALPNTNATYWLAMLTAGVFGTVLGDICSHAFGQGASSLGLTAFLPVVLFAGRQHAAQIIALYWATVAVARTVGSAIGDWLAESKALHIGLPLSTLTSCLAFVAVLVFWRSRPKNA